MEKSYKRLEVRGKKVEILLTIGTERPRLLHAEEMTLEESGVVILRNVNIPGHDGGDVLISPPYFIEVVK